MGLQSVLESVHLSGLSHGQDRVLSAGPSSLSPGKEAKSIRKRVPLGVKMHLLSLSLSPTFPKVVGSKKVGTLWEEGSRSSVSVCVCVVCLCLCEREKENDRETERDRQREGEAETEKQEGRECEIMCSSRAEPLQAGGSGD